MVNCPACGEPLKSKSKYCVECGTQVESLIKKEGAKDKLRNVSNQLKDKIVDKYNNRNKLNQEQIQAGKIDALKSNFQKFKTAQKFVDREFYTDKVKDVLLSKLEGFNVLPPIEKLRNQLELLHEKYPNDKVRKVNLALENLIELLRENSKLGEIEYNEWLENLDKRLEENICVVCFQGLTESDIGDIVICPHCQAGGHADHLLRWVNDKHTCPLCRSTLNSNELQKLVIST